MFDALYDSNGEFIRTEIINEYAVDLDNEKIIEGKVHREDGTWEWNQEYLDIP